jgi:hypothetical protein
MALNREARIAQLETLPARLEQVLRGASAQALDTTYRDGGWTARQVVHHLADSHMNAYIRSRLILTEERPALKPYDQDAWAALPDASSGPLEVSLAILRGLHTRWASFFRALPEDAWSRTGLHPEIGAVTLADILDSYAAHGDRHLDHVRAAIQRAA